MFPPQPVSPGLQAAPHTSAITPSDCQRPAPLQVWRAAPMQRVAPGAHSAPHILAVTGAVSQRPEALQTCGAELALAHHHGTFQLTNEAIDAPEKALVAARVNAGIEPDRFRVLKPGQVWEIEGKATA